MKLDVKEQGQATIVDVKGNLMGGPETFSVHAKIKELLAQKKNKIIINLSDVSWINSSGLGMLMGCLTSIKNAEGSMKLTGITEKVKNLFIITKLITLFDTYDTIQEAVQAFDKK